MIINSHNMTGILEDELQYYAQDDTTAEELWHNYRFIKNKLENEFHPWTSIEEPKFTDHGSDHVESVIIQAGKLLESNIDELNQLDIFTLLMSIIWHDVGMFKGRENHEDESVKVANEIKKEAFPPDPGIFGVVAKIVKAHRGKTGLEDVDSNEVVTVNKTPYEVNSQALAAILRFADEIAENSTRVSGSEQVLDNIPDDQMVYWVYPRTIKGIIPKPDRERLRIEYEMSKQQAQSCYECPDNLKDRLGKNRISMMEYCIVRLEKTNNERLYCDPNFGDYLSLKDIDVKIQIVDEDTHEILVESSEVLTGSGLKRERAPDIQIFNDFFKKNPELDPDNMGGK